MIILAGGKYSMKMHERTDKSMEADVTCLTSRGVGRAGDDKSWNSAWLTVKVARNLGVVLGFACFPLVDQDPEP